MQSSFFYYLKRLQGFALKIPKPGKDILDSFSNQAIEMTVFNVGPGEAIIINKGKKGIAIDCGSERSNEKLGQELRKYLKRKHIKLIALVASHNHTDHLNALVPMLDGDSEEILADDAKFYYNGQKLKAKLKLQEKLKDLKHTIRKVIVDSTIRKLEGIGEKQITLFTDGSGWPNDYYSVFMHIPYGDATFLLTGDAPFSYEKKLIKNKKTADFVKGDVLKITHHGSAHGTGSDFLEHAAPVIYVSSSARDERHNLEENVISRINDYDPHVVPAKDLLGKTMVETLFDTCGDNGDIIIRTDGRTRWLEHETGAFKQGVLYEVEVRTPGMISKLTHS